MSRATNREGAASAAPDPRSISDLAYHAAFARWGRLLTRLDRIEEQLSAAHMQRGNVVSLFNAAPPRKLERFTPRADALRHAAMDACYAIEHRVARSVPETLAELRASAELFAFIDSDDGLGGFFNEDSGEHWCRSLTLAVTRLLPP